MPLSGTTHIGGQSCVQCNGAVFMLLVFVSKPDIISVAISDMTKKSIENPRKHKYPIHYIQIKIGVDKGC